MKQLKEVGFDVFLNQPTDSARVVCGERLQHLPLVLSFGNADRLWLGDLSDLSVV